MWVIGVAKKYVSHGKTHPRAKKFWHVYYYDDSGRLVSRSIKWWDVPFYKARVKRVVLFACQGCGLKFKSIKNSNPSCPNCEVI